MLLRYTTSIMAEKFTPSGSARYFIAIVPPEPSYTETLDTKLYFRTMYNSKAALNSPPHITLHMPFFWKEKKEDLLKEKLNAFAGEASPFQIDLSGFGSFPPRVIFIKVATNPYLFALQSALQQFCKRELQLFNSDYKDMPFHPHLTVAFRDLKKEKFKEAWAEFENKSFDHSFPCSTFTLLKHDGKVWNTFQHFLLSNKPAISNLV